MTNQVSFEDFVGVLDAAMIGLLIRYLENKTTVTEADGAICDAAAQRLMLETFNRGVLLASPDEAGYQKIAQSQMRDEFVTGRDNLSELVRSMYDEPNEVA